MSLSRAWPSLLIALAPLLCRAQEQDVSALPTNGASAAVHAEDRAYLFRHNPFYFAYGNPISKLQLSFRTQLISEAPIFLAYTQLMFWALRQDSKPFHDLTYNPEAFYRLKVKKLLPIKSVDFGWMHDSNGKAGEDSRSYNSIYLRLNAEAETEHSLLRASLTGSYLHAFDETNRDIQTYIGPLAYKLALIHLWNAWIDRSELALQAIPGGKFSQNWGRGGYQISCSFRVGSLNLVPSFYLQYYSGFAESLLNYSQYIHAFRVGVIF